MDDGEEGGFHFLISREGGPRSLSFLESLLGVRLWVFL